MDVDRLLAEAQISVLTSNWEGFPLSILEYMRAGLPVVASSVGGVDEAVSDGRTGYLVPRGDGAVLREKLQRLLADPTLRARMGAEGRSCFEQEFTLDRAVSRTLAVYGAVVAAREARNASGARTTSVHAPPSPDVRR
jgi:glycosyltransferase involved in cell wall biosynthesis